MPSPVKTAAPSSSACHVVTPEKSREITDEVVARPTASSGVVVAFGQLLPPSLLEGGAPRAS